MTLQEIITDIHALKDDLETYELSFRVNLMGLFEILMPGWF